MKNFIFLSYLQSRMSFLLFSAVILGLLSVNTVAVENTSSAKDKAIAIENTVNINHATAKDIAVTLKGIGLKKAEAIVEWRETNGKFTYIEQLIEVKGIGEKTLMQNKGKISL